MGVGRRTAGRGAGKRKAGKRTRKASPLGASLQGRVVELRSSWKPGEFEAMRASLPARRAELRIEIGKRVEELVGTIRSYAPLSLIGPLFIKNCMGDPEAYSEPTHEGVESYVEYGIRPTRRVMGAARARCEGRPS